jgi:hypothetical protein
MFLVLLLECGFQAIKYNSRGDGIAINTKMIAGAIVQMDSIISPSRINRLFCLF